MALTVATAGTGVARTAHYVTPTGASAPIQTLLLEPQRTNLCIRSEEFSNAAWTKTNCTVDADVIIAPDGTLTADLLTATASSGNALRQITFTGDGEKCAAIYLRQGTGAFCDISIVDNTAGTSRHRVRVTFGSGTATLSTGTGAGTLYPVEALANGWVRVLFSATGIVAANVNQLFVYPDGTGSGAGPGTATVYAWGAQVENAIVPSSYIKTEGTTVTRNADSFYLPFTAPPQRMTVYVRGVEQIQGVGITAPRILQIGAAANTDPRLAIYRDSLDSYRLLHDPATSSESDSAVTVTRGQLVEIRGTLSSGGAPTVAVSVNGGAESVASAGTAQPLAVAWSDTRIYLNSIGTSNVGMFAFTHVAIVPGIQTMAEMRAIAGVS